MSRPRLTILAGSMLCASGLAAWLWLHANEIRPSGIILHHSATAPAARATDASDIDAIHRDRGFGIFYRGRIYHIGYHYVVLADGTVEAGRPERCRGAHARGHNDYLGVCLIGNFSTPAAGGPGSWQQPTAQQLVAASSLCRSLSARYRLPAERIRLHRECNPGTECPGRGFPSAARFAQLRAEEQRQARAGRGGES